jgi:hypothetical protein
MDNYGQQMGLKNEEQIRMRKHVPKEQTKSSSSTHSIINLRYQVIRGKQQCQSAANLLDRLLSEEGNSKLKFTKKGNKRFRLVVAAVVTEADVVADDALYTYANFRRSMMHRE